MNLFYGTANSSVAVVGPLFSSPRPIRRQRSYALASGKPSVAPTIHNLLINTLPSPSYRLEAPLSVVVEEAEDIAVASFEAANIHMSGETIKESIENLLSLMIDMLEIFNKDQAHLGKEPARQLDILRTYITPRKASQI